jgi:UrcA family protein
MMLFRIALPLLVLTPVAASAQGAPPAVAVSYSDLNLHSEAAVKVLDRRIARAVRSVCGDGGGVLDPVRHFAIKRCVRKKSAEVTALRNHAIASYPSQERLAWR